MSHHTSNYVKLNKYFYAMHSRHIINYKLKLTGYTRSSVKYGYCKHILHNRIEPHMQIRASRRGPPTL